MKATYLVTFAVVAIALGGCQRTSIGTMDTSPRPLTPAPVGGVETTQLPPPSTPEPGQFPDAPAAPAQTAPASAELAANAQPVTREALIGRWSANAGGGRCDIFLSLTKWTGGYRAASRGCAGPAAAISAWNVQGNQVILSDSNGNRVASLYQSGNERYDGSTSAGAPISLSR